VLLIVAVTKFTSGAWVPLLVIPLIVLLFKGIHRHYASVAEALHTPSDYRPPRRRHTAVVLVGQLHAGALEALAYAQSIAPDHLVAMSVVADEREAERAEKQWMASDVRVPLEIVISPSLALTDATLTFIEELERRWAGAMVTVIIPEMFVEHWWQHLLHNQSALILKGRLLFRKHVAVTSIPYRIA
jgi:hypothetical protein